VDRGLWVFLIVAVMSWVTVWAVLMHPRGVRDEPNPFARAEPYSEWPPPGFLPSGQSASRAEEEILTTRGIVPSTDNLRREIQSIGTHLPDEKAVPRLVSAFPGRADRFFAGHLPSAAIDRQEPANGVGGEAGTTGIGSSGAATTKADCATVDGGSAGRSSREIPAVHDVRDGDTLPSLAARYLGDASLWPILYEINRDRIPSPDLLPLGLTLIVDPARAARVRHAPSLFEDASDAIGSELPPLESVEMGGFANPTDADTRP